MTDYATRKDYTTDVPKKPAVELLIERLGEVAETMCRDGEAGWQDEITVVLVAVETLDAFADKAPPDLYKLANKQAAKMGAELVRS